MNTSKSHRCWEGEQREILLGVFTHFYRFSKGDFRRRSPICTVVCCTAAEILVDFRSNFIVDSSHPPKSVQNINGHVWATI